MNMAPSTLCPKPRPRSKAHISLQKMRLLDSLDFLKMNIIKTGPYATLVIKLEVVDMITTLTIARTQCCQNKKGQDIHGCLGMVCMEMH